VRTVTATEASRSFAALLDEVERGGSVIVTRGGRRVAVLAPVPVANGAALLEPLNRGLPDEDYAGEVLAIRDVVTADGLAWRDD
jgi:prevent-host-death family protein